MKNALLNIVMVMFAACCCMSCVYDYYPEEVAEENQVTLALNMRLLGYGATRAGADVLPAERISALRVVLVDLGVDSNNNKEAEPSVEYNKVLHDISLNGELDNDGIVHLQFPRIRADRQKKIYLLINCEESYLEVKVGDKVINLGNDELLYLPGDGTASPIEDATFVSPKGSYSKNDVPDELLVPMTAFHSFTVPSIAELEKNYILNANLVYTLPNELYVVRAINKITFDFVNATKDAENEGIELLVKDWSISKINTGASYLFAHPGKNTELFKNDVVEGNMNPDWMQWLKAEADRSQDPEKQYSPKWLTEYSMPGDISYGEYKFVPGGSDDGYILPAPEQNNNTTVTLSTENDPVYFSESCYAVDGQPQRYELAFTVKQKENGKWGNEYPYRATSSLTNGWDGLNYFNLQSLFRSTHVKVTVTFRSGLGHPDFEIDVHPYGGYALDPVFGLGQ